MSDLRNYPIVTRTETARLYDKLGFPYIRCTTLEGQDYLPDQDYWQTVIVPRLKRQFPHLKPPPQPATPTRRYRGVARATGK